MDISKNEYHKKYYEANKEKQREYYKEKVKCTICGAVYAKSNSSNHKKSKKHNEAMDKLENKYEHLKAKYRKLRKKYYKLAY
ncbi:hypothetical protein [Zamilon virus]|uniref:Uncharacterized protein n=1 Tax=Zamilon virus TaxID=1411887 RepID=V6BPN6_9VIRU|nr:hypothetical protein X812_gp08 [Zamilon virus]CDI70051.1 hypothetical protein [Zamilon virus]